MLFRSAMMSMYTERHGIQRGKQNERADNPNSILNFGQMSLRKLSMICPEGTKVKINGKEIPLITGIFELGMDQINITSLEFSEAVNVNIYYMF